MPLLGQAALAMWWDIAPDMRSEFEDWHSHEHFPERLAIPGFARGSRWCSATGGEGFFVIYELEAYETLTSPRYVQRLNNPTPWSTALFPHHRNMVRSQCRVLETFGSGVAGLMLTIRFSPDAGREDAVRRELQEVLRTLPSKPGLTGGHLLRTETPKLEPTAEQKIRGGRDGTADWIVLVTGYDARVLDDLTTTVFASRGLGTQAARSDLFRLSFAATARDIAV